MHAGSLPGFVCDETEVGLGCGMPSLIGIPTLALVLLFLSGCERGSPQAAADPVEEPIKAIPCAGEWKLELVEQTRSCPIDPLGLRFGLVGEGTELELVRAGYPLELVESRSTDTECSLELRGRDRFTEAAGEFRLSLQARGAEVSGTITRPEGSCDPITVHGERIEGVPAKPPRLDPAVLLRQTLAKLLAHCDLGVTLESPDAFRFVFHVTATGQLAGLDRDGAPVDLAQRCGDWRGFEMQGFLPRADPEQSTYPLEVRPLEIHAEGVGPVVLGMESAALARLGMQPRHVRGHATFTQEGKQHPISVRFSEDWYWPDLENPQLVAHVDGAQGRALHLTVPRREGSPELDEVHIPPVEAGPFLYGHRLEEIVESLEGTLGPDPAMVVRGQALRDVTSGAMKMSYELLSFCHLKWKTESSWQHQTFVAVDGAVYWSDGGGRELPDGSLLICTSHSEVFHIAPSGEVRAWYLDHDAWRSLPATCEAVFRGRFLVECRSAKRSLPGSNSFIKLGRTLLPFGHIRGVGATSSRRLTDTYPTQERRACEALIGRYWGEVRPAVHLYGEVDEHLIEERYRRDRDTRRFVDECVRAPEDLRSCLVAPQRDALQEGRRCLEQYRTVNPEGDAASPPSLPSLPSLRDTVSLPPEPPQAPLSKAAQKSEWNRLVGEWTTARETRGWRFEADGRVRTKWGNMRDGEIASPGVLRLTGGSHPDVVFRYELVGDELFLHEKFIRRLADRERFVVDWAQTKVFFVRGECFGVDELGLPQTLPCERTREADRETLVVRAGGEEARYFLFAHAVVPAFLEPYRRVQ
jgi:hypothetical protein